MEDGKKLFEDKGIAIKKWEETRRGRERRGR